jgi:hypothetical protein
VEVKVGPQKPKIKLCSESLKEELKIRVKKTVNGLKVTTMNFRVNQVQ